MVVFLIFFIPAGALLYLKCMYSGYFDGGEMWHSLFRGIASFAISSIPLFIIVQFYPVEYSTGALYTRFLFTDFVLFLIGALISYFLWEQRKIHVVYGKPLFVRVFSFFAGYAAFIGLFQRVVHLSRFNAYQLFAYPLLVALVFWYASVCIYFYCITSGWMRYLWVVLITVPALLSAVVPLFHITGYVVFSWISAVLILLFGSGSAVLLIKYRRVP